ncbi:MAG: monoacylglycerol lipase [Chloroflexota bacterium]
MNHSESVLPGCHGYQLHSQCWAPDHDPRAAIAIVHGYAEHSGRYSHVVEYFVPRDYEVCAFDHRGHGRSPGRRGHINAWTEYREDVRIFVTVIQNRRPGLPVFLYGHSLGGLIALEYALHYPDGPRGLIASAPALGGLYVNPLLFHFSRVMSYVWPSFTRKGKVSGEGLSRDPAVAPAFRGDPLVHNHASARFGREMQRAMNRTMAGASGLRVPLLIIHGTEDRVVAQEPSQRFFDQATLADKDYLSIPGGYHEPHNDLDWEAVLQYVERWIERHLATNNDNAARE